LFVVCIRRDMTLSSTTGLVSSFTRVALSVHNLVRAQSALLATLVIFERLSSRRNDVYNILWAVVFGFATLNILSLAARRFEPNRRGLTFGELMAVLIVLLSIFLLGWELLSVFHIFPIKLNR
jgi:glucan phosphoethanolaminetransferase (alkaline phosphatase superfamily)